MTRKINPVWFLGYFKIFCFVLISIRRRFSNSVQRVMHLFTPTLDKSALQMAVVSEAPRHKQFVVSGSPRCRISLVVISQVVLLSHLASIQ